MNFPRSKVREPDGLLCWRPNAATLAARLLAFMSDELTAMNLVYVCPFPLDQTSGKNKATTEKVEVLSKLADDVTVYAPSTNRGKLFLLVAVCRCELQAAFRLIFPESRPTVLLTRGLSGFFCVPLARLLGVLSVREVHADAREEVPYIAETIFERAAFYLAFTMVYFIDLAADVRIYNNPKLREHYERLTGAMTSVDLTVYNGAAWREVSSLNQEEARRKFNLGSDDDEYILAFVGSAAAWHGVRWLHELQKALDAGPKSIRVVCGGGPIPMRTESRVLNITPLGPSDCANLIRAADACLLPVDTEIRSSPGSPLKLYDYISNGRPVITQKSTLGYSDEVKRYAIGICVDFTKPHISACDIVHFLEEMDRSGFERRCRHVARYYVSWEKRMGLWIEGMRRAVRDRKSTRA